MAGAQLPEITEVQRLQLKPGDSLIIRMDADVLTMHEAAEIATRVQDILRRPDLPVLVTTRETRVEVMSGEPG